ncbi:MAG TPA: tetratricopeptide repeat protein [Stellaceae bacterium]|nr:tetratricopeptide repeat protein [Stellaceae bacterium]
MLEDRYGNALTTSSPAARDAYVTGVDRLLSADAGIVAAFEEAVAVDEAFALGHIALARTLQVQGRGSEVKAPLERGLALAAGATPREQSHVGIFEQILTGRGGAAIPGILKHLQSWPCDAMVLAPITGVFGLIGFSGKAGREVEQLAVLEPFASAYGDDWWFRMVLAFAQIELHEYERGLRNIETSLRGFGRNAHAAHIRAHLFYELGEREAGFAYLDDWNRDYPPEGQLHCHISWHRALWSLEIGHRERAWEIYRTSLKPGAAWGPPLNVLTDCASFLLRADMAGETVDPTRWSEIADFAAHWFPNSGMIFADVHSALAFAMAGRRDVLQSLIDRPQGPAADILVPIARGFDAFAQRNWASVVEEIGPILETHERVGGSRAQRDLLEYTVTTALLRSGRRDEGLQLLSTRRPANGKGGYPLAGLQA